MSTFYDENGNEKETMQSEETENLRKRKRKKKAKQSEKLRNSRIVFSVTLNFCQNKTGAK